MMDDYDSIGERRGHRVAGDTERALLLCTDGRLAAKLRSRVVALSHSNGNQLRRYGNV